MKTLAKIALITAGVISAYAVHAAPITRIVGNWHLDEGRGQKAMDSSGYGKTGIVGKTLSKEQEDPAWIARRFDNAALSFDGATNKYIKIGHGVHLEPQKISVEAWVKPGVTGEDDLPIIVGKSGDLCDLAAYSLYIHKDGSGNLGVPFFYVASADGTVNVESPEGAPSLWDGQWHHLVGTYDRVAVRLYVDGVEIGIGTPANHRIGYSRFTNKSLTIGDGAAICGHGTSYVGEIDEVKIWNKALTAEEVASRYLAD